MLDKDIYYKEKSKQRKGFGKKNRDKIIDKEATEGLRATLEESPEGREKPVLLRSGRTRGNEEQSATGQEHGGGLEDGGGPQGRGEEGRDEQEAGLHRATSAPANIP